MNLNNWDRQLFWFKLHTSFWDTPSGLFEHSYFVMQAAVCSVACNEKQQSTVDITGLQFSLLTVDLQNTVSDWLFDLSWKCSLKRFFCIC